MSHQPTYVGELPWVKGRKLKTYAEGRECREKGCVTVLARTNPGPYCHCHQQAREVEAATRAIELYEGLQKMHPKEVVTACKCTPYRAKLIQLGEQQPDARERRALLTYIRRNK